MLFQQHNLQPPPPPVANSKSTNTGASNESSLKTEDSSKKSEYSEISENRDAKTAEPTNSNAKPEVSSGAGTDKTETESKSETTENNGAKPESKTTGKTVVNTKAEPKADTKTDPKTETNPKPESKTEPTEKPKTTEKNDAKSETSTTNNQMFLASTGGKPAPNQTPQAQTTELKVSLVFETMNGDNNNAFVKADSDFGQLNFETWPGPDLDKTGKDVKDAFKNIQFQIKDITDKDKKKHQVVATTAGTYDPKTATFATKSLGSYDSTHTYEVSVVNSTIPSPYYVTYNDVATDEDASFKSDVTHFTWTPSKVSDKKSQNKYFRLNVMEIVYAKDESVAAKCFSYEQAKNDDGSYRSDGNWNFKYNNDNIFAKLRVKDNAIQFPSTHPTKAGFKFDGWQFYVAKKTNGGPYTSYDRIGDDNKNIINSTTVAYSPFGIKPYIDYPYIFALIRDNKGVNTFGSKLGTQYCTTNHTFVVFPKWVEAGYKVTFIDEGKTYKTVKVEENKSINSDEWTAESMPTGPSKPGFTFNGWFTQKNGKGTQFTGDTPVTGNISVYSSYTSKPPTPPSPAPEPEPEPAPTPEPEPDIDWDDIPDIDLTTDKEPEPVPFIVAPAPILPPAEAEPEPAPAPSQPEQQKQPEPKHVAKHLPKTGSTATPILASAIASLFAGLAGLAESFAATRKRRN